MDDKFSFDKTDRKFFGKRTKEEKNYNNEIEEQDYYEISLKELIEVIIKGKKTILLITVLAVLLTFIGSYMVPRYLMQTNGETKTVVEFYFDNIKAGKNPHGQAFDINEVRSPAIIKQVIDELNLSRRGISVDTIRKNMSFQEIIPDNVIEELSRLKDVKDDELRISKLENISYHPNQYIVILNLDRKMGLSLEEGTEVLNHIIRKYQDWFYETYTYRPVLSNAITKDFNFKNYDYKQSADILNSQLSLMEQFVDSKNASDFRSRETGLSYSEIQKSLSLVRDIELERLYTIIGAFNLTKDSQKAIVLYEAEAEEKQLEAAKKQEEKSMLNNLINNFKRDNTSLLLGDVSGESVDIKNESEYYNTLITRYTAAGTQASNAINDAQFLLNEAQLLRTDTIAPNLKVQARKDAETMIDILKEKIMFWSDQINITTDEYYTEAFYQKYVEQLVPAQSDIAKLGKGYLNLAIALALGLMLGVFTVFFREYMKE